jgi:uncharacterized protein YbjT (DUF2867 family)
VALRQEKDMILVIGGTGTVGALLVRELQARNVQVKVLTRDPAKALPKGVTKAVGDLLEPDTLRSVFQGVDSVYMANASGPSEAHEGLNAIVGAKAAGVKRFVYQSVFGAGNTSVPIIASKTIIEACLKASGMRHVILRPNNFDQNDAWYREPLMQYGIYPQPLGNVGVARVDVRDIAEAGAIALTSLEADSQTYNIVGPQNLTAAGVAAIWSEVLGRPIAPAKETLDEWEAATGKFMPARIVYDLRLLFDLFHTSGFNASPTDISRQIQLLGHAPRDFKSFAEECAVEWKV